MRELVARYGPEYRDENEMVEGLLAEISYLKNSFMAPEAFSSAHCGDDIFRTIYKEYQAFLTRQRLLDFDDMLVMTHQLFTERKDILSAWQKKYRYILIDEFQRIVFLRMLTGGNNDSAGTIMLLNCQLKRGCR